MKVIKSYFIGVYANKELLLMVNDETMSITTDQYGGFSIVIDEPVTTVPEIATANQQKIEIIQKYPMLFPDPKNAFDVISDIDDTIMLSNTASFLKRIGTVALVTPHKRKTVLFTQQLLEIVRKQNIRVIYISKSESNLLGIITSFINHHQLPRGPLLLTPYQHAGQLFRSKKGKNFKLNNIRFIIENSTNKKFILFGDDSQKDMDIYANIAKQYPHSIVKIYIRQTKAKVSKRQQQKWETLKSIFPGSVYFNDKTNIPEALENLGLLTHGSGEDVAGVATKNISL